MNHINPHAVFFAEISTNLCDAFQSPFTMSVKTVELICFFVVEDHASVKLGSCWPEWVF